MRPLNLAALVERVHAELLAQRGRGRVADYIPALATVDPMRFGIAAAGLDGRLHCAGDAHQRFSIQSISKLFALILALQMEGRALWRRVGREPSGTAFNSLVQLEHEAGVPRNPFINAGALVVVDVLCARHAVPQNAVQELLGRLIDSPPPRHDAAVARSEREHAHRNAAMAHLMKSFGNLRCPVDQVLDAYCRQCAIEMSCTELARAALLLAGHGLHPSGGERLLPGSLAKRLNALLLTCGTYDAAGDFAFRVGLPAKSGVGGGIVAVLPGECALCVWSPGLDEAGNSLLGTLALERFTTLSGRSVF
jgi:glutaminase